MKNRKIRLLLMAVMLIYSGLQTLFAQENLHVTGTVTDSKTGEPLIGAAVRVIDAIGGTITDLDGNYTINAKSGATIEFSYMGYIAVTKKVTQSIIDVEMREDEQLLDEVVVVGYGVQKKSSLTGSVSSVKLEDLEGRGVSDISSALSGKISGTQSFSSSAAPGSKPSLQIRGIGSNGSSAPLYVIDGRVTTDPGGIDPNDIESVELLKDGASAAIYGASAGNGVILITTRKGKGNGTISYEFQLSSQSLGNVPHVMNAEQFLDFYSETGALTKSTAYTYWDRKQNTDWTDVMFENSLMQRHSLKFQGGNDKSNYYASLSYLNNDGIVVGDRDVYKRYSGMVNASYKVKPWLEIGTNNQIEYSEIHSVQEGGAADNLFTSTLALDPLTPPTYTLDNMPDKMREIYDNPAKYGNLLQDGKGNYYSISPFITTDKINPLIIRDKADDGSRILSVTGTAYANLTPIKGMVLTSRLSYAFTNKEVYSPGYNHYGDYGSGHFQNYMSLTASSGNTNYWQWENFANYTHAFDNHNLGLMLGTSYSETRIFDVKGTVSGNTDGDLGFLQDDPNYMYFDYATLSAVRTLSGGEPLYSRKLAYFGRLNYDYKNTYLAQFSLRADAADLSILPQNKRWGYFPAASFGWVISNEKFMEKTRDWLDQFKFRASWGQNGSLASLGGYVYDMTIKQTGKYNFSDIVDYSYGYAPTVTGNKDLKWETSEQLDLGIDLRLLNGRLSLSADYYNKKTKDLIISDATLSNLMGFESSPINAGSIENKGFEVEIGWQEKIRDFSYGIRANMTTLKNKVTKVYDGFDKIGGHGNTEPMTMFEVGQPAWYFYGFKYLGVDEATGDPVFEDVSEDGQIGIDDKTYIGKGIPDFSYGITLNAAWKGFDFLVFGKGVAGVDILNAYENTAYTINRLTHYTEDRWTPTNTIASMPRADGTSNNFRNSDAYVFDGSYFKIKQIQIGYTLPKELLKNISISNLRVYGSLEDFITFSSYIGYDPEIVGVGNAIGVDLGSYPSSKKVIIGLNLTF